MSVYAAEGLEPRYHLGVYFGLRDNSWLQARTISSLPERPSALWSPLQGSNVKPEEIWKNIPPIAHEFREPMGFTPSNLTNIGQYCIY